MSETGNSNKNLKNQLNESKSLSIYIRIFINYSQMIAIIHSLELKWPYYVATYLRVSGNVGSVNTQLFSLDCLISDYDLNIEVIYLKAMSNSLIYLGFIIGAAGVFLMKWVFYKIKNEKSKFIIFTIVISILMQPNTIKDTSDLFNCQSINEKKFLYEEMKVECYTPDHTRWVYLFS